jgi:hypothetical protein
MSKKEKKLLFQKYKRESTNAKKKRKGNLHKKVPLITRKGHFEFQICE